MPKFSFSIDASSLIKGLRSSRQTIRNAGFLVESIGAVGRKSALAALEDLSRIDVSDITDSFPFPQLFCFTNLIIVCGSSKIYEWNGTALVLKLETTAGSLWQAVDFYDYVYMSNGAVAVVRAAETKAYSESSLPSAGCIMNFNGQVLIGSADSTVNGANLFLGSGRQTATVSLEGSWA